MLVTTTVTIATAMPQSPICTYRAIVITVTIMYRATAMPQSPICTDRAIVITVTDMYRATAMLVMTTVNTLYNQWTISYLMIKANLTTSHDTKLHVM